MGTEDGVLHSLCSLRCCMTNWVEKMFICVCLNNLKMWKSWLKTQLRKKTKIMASGPITSWQIDGETAGTVTDSSTLAWKIPWMEEPGRLQAMGSLRVGHDWATSLSLFTFMHWRNGNPLQCSCLENPRDGGAWWAAVYGVAQSWTRLKWLSSSTKSLQMVTAAMKLKDACSLEENLRPT